MLIADDVIHIEGPGLYRYSSYICVCVCVCVWVCVY